jgi:outer membrane protein assembly factor BamB
MLARRWFLAQAGLAMAADWPEFRGRGDSLGGTARLPLTWGPAKNVAWSTATPGYGHSSPVVWGNRIFLTAIDGAEKETLLVVCLDARSGREIWKRQFAAIQRVKNNDMTSKGAPTPCADRGSLV